MILNRIIRMINRAPLRMTLTSTFGTSYQETSKMSQIDLMNRIDKVDNLKSFFALLNSSNNCDLSLILMSEPKLNSLLLQPKQMVKEDVLAYLGNIKKANISTCTNYDLYGLIRTVNKIQALFHTFASFQVHQTKLLLANKLIQLVQLSLFETPQDLHKLISYLRVLSGGNFESSRVLVTKIYDLMHKQIQELNTLQMSWKDVSILFETFKRNAIISSKEQTIIKLLFSHIAKNLKQIPPAKLVQISLSLHRMNHYTLTPPQRTLIKAMQERLVQLIPDLEISQISWVLSQKYNSLNLLTLKPVVVEMVAQLYNSIKEDGTTELKDQDVFGWIVNSSNKVQLKYFSQQKSKVKAFLINYIRNNRSKSAKNQIIISKRIASMIEGNYFQIMKKDMFEILGQLDSHIHIELLYQLKYLNKDEQYLRLIQRAKVEINDLEIGQLLKAAYLYHFCLMNSQNKQLKEYFLSKSKKVGEIFASEKEFKKMAYKCIYDQKLCTVLQKLIQVDPKLLTTIPIKLTEKGNSKVYESIAYVNLVFKCTDGSYANKFRIENKQLFKPEFMFMLISEQTHFERQLIPNVWILKQINHQLAGVNHSKDRTLLKKLIKYLNKYVPSLICNMLNNHCKEQLWKSFDLLIKQKDVIIASKLRLDLMALFQNLTNKIYLWYNYSPKYRYFLVRLIQNSQLYEKSLFSQLNILRAAFSLNILKPGMLKITNKTVLSNLTKDEIHQYQTLINKEYVIQCSPMEIQQNLQILVLNQNSHQLLDQNMDIVDSTIAQMPLHRLQKVLVNMEIRNQKVSSQIIRTALNQIVLKINQSTPFDLYGILQLTQRNSSILIKQFASLFEKYVQVSCANLEQFQSNDPQLVSQMVRYLNSQLFVSSQITQKFFQLVEVWLQKATPLGRCIVYSELLNSSYKFKPQELSQVSNLLEYNILIGIKFFLYLENQFDTQRRQSIVGKIVDILQKKKKSKVSTHLYNIFYQYLKVVYPQTTHNLVLESSQIRKWQFSSAPSKNVEQYLKQAASVLNLELTQMHQFSPNTIYKLNNTLLYFPIFHKKNASLERDFLKKAIKVITNSQMPVFDIYNSRLFEFILQDGLLFDKNQILQLKEKSPLFSDADSKMLHD